MKKLNRGFTLLEVLVTLAVVSLVASVVFVGFDKARKTSYDSKTLNDISQIQLSLQLYYQDHGFYPSCSDQDDQKKTCCIGTDSCYSKVEAKEYLDDLFKIVTSLNTTKPNTTANLAAAATWYWNKLGPILPPGYGYNCAEIYKYINDIGTEILTCKEATIEYSNAEGTVTVLAPAGDTRNIGWVAPSVAQDVVPPGGGCPTTDDNALWPDDSCDFNNEPGATLCNDSRAPNDGEPGDCMISSLPVGSGTCWGTNTPTITCESQSRFGVGPGWSNGACVVSQGTYYNNVKQSATGYGCGFTPTPTGGTGGGTIDEANPPPTSPIVFGCTDSFADNYNQEATADDGTCMYGNNDVYGCTDPFADNYNQEATADDGTCMYGNNDVYGCMDSTATNYNEYATIDDGSCYNSSSDPSSSSSDVSSSSSEICQDSWASNYESPLPCEYSSSSSSS